MYDKNIVLLEGILGDDYKYGRTTDGKEFATFSLHLNAFRRDMSDNTERTHGQTFIRVFVYDKGQVEYLHRVNAHRGQRASLYGRISSHMNEYKGHSYLVNAVVCRDISIIKTRTERRNVTAEELEDVDDAAKYLKDMNE